MTKGLIYLFIFIGGTVGSYLPVILFHAGFFSLWSIVGSLIGSFAGLWVGYKLSTEF
jgi:hypothetical protein